MKKTVLVIESDTDIRDVVSFILTEQGYHVVELDTEVGALERVIELQPDCVILDLKNPSEEGSKLCMDIKGTEETKNISVIALSTHPRAVDLKNVCADDVVAKPFDIDVLIEIVESQLQE